MKEYYTNIAYIKEGYSSIKVMALFDSNFYKGEGIFCDSYSKVNYINTNILAYYEMNDENQNPINVLKTPLHFDKIQVADIYEIKKIVAGSDSEAIQTFIKQSGRRVAKNNQDMHKKETNTAKKKKPGIINLYNDNPTIAEKGLFKHCHLYRISSKEKYVRYVPVYLDEGYSSYPEAITINQEKVDFVNDVIFHKDTQNVTIYKNKFDINGISLILDRCKELGFTQQS